MPKREYPLDRSAAFTALLDLSPEFAGLDMNEGAQVINDFLAEWYKSPATNMYDFAREWVPAWRAHVKGAP